MSCETNSTIKCDVCEQDGPELYCMTCDPEGLPYHTTCWGQQRLHNKPKKPHRQISLRDIEHLRYINEPNKWDSIADKSLKEDIRNCFIEYKLDVDSPSQSLQFGPRASPLLRHKRDQGHPQYPSFVSFVGRTMNGKSFLLRALQGNEAVPNFPNPIPAPGSKQGNNTSTSCDIHLYADSESAKTETPILFLDCEGFEGSDTPSTYLVKTDTTPHPEMMKSRRKTVDAAYPRFIYAFSTCIVYVTSGALAESADIGRRLHSYAFQGATGSENQGFKPSLFVVFNRFRDGSSPDFDWSIESSTKTFLEHEGLGELKHFYDTIYVVYIPCLLTDMSGIALKQIKAFKDRLRETHRVAFQRRLKFQLVFNPLTLVHFLWRALELFSGKCDSVFDWSVEAAGPERVGPSDVTAPFQDLWTQCSKHFATRTKRRQTDYELARGICEKHAMLCCHLRLGRESSDGARVGTFLPSLDAMIKHIDQILIQYSPCGASSESGIECRETRHRHGDHHQGSIRDPHFIFERWPGNYQQPEGISFRTFREAFEATLQGDEMEKVSLLYTPQVLSPSISSIISCFGCLQGPPSTILSCGHAFCLDCIRDLADNPQFPHRLEHIKCPFHNSIERLSPRLLPIQSGYRILSLDGGGVKGLAQLIILRHIERKCFEIPTTQLYDLIVGTSIGGLIALALAAPTSAPLTVAEATDKVKELIMSGFNPKMLATLPILSLVMDKTKYKAKNLEAQLQSVFGKEAKLHAASTTQSLPNVAVTTVVEENLKGHLVTNYNRKPTAHEAYPLLLEPDPDKGMPIWAAARCTSAAFPYFKGFSWQGQMLLDGAFQLNCPVVGAFSEGKCVWPDKRCDVLLSLGTGKSSARHQPSSHHAVRLLKAIAHNISDSEATWENFAADPPQAQGIFRLNPVYHGTGFELDDVRKLEEIEKQTEAWIAASTMEITVVCDQLIAALFFFHPAGSPDSVQGGEILCRLPVDMEARQKLIDGMLDEQDLNLFSVEYVGGDTHTINVEQSLRAVSSGLELRIPVNISFVGVVTINIRMRHLGHARDGPSPNPWTPISGSPYVHHWDGNWSCGS